MPGIKDAKCILVIGATAGIGHALALAIHDLETKPTVIVAGRRQERLDELSRQSERIKAVRVDINTHHDNLKTFVQDTLSKYPDLDTILLSSGIQHILDFTKPESIDFDKIDDEFNTNYLAIIKLIVLFLPHFLTRSSEGYASFIIPITSGLAIVPKSEVPNYCATKAGLHSFDMSLRIQLRNTNVHVLEIIPPLTESELHDKQGTTPVLSRFWMPLDEFTKQTMEGLIRGDPDIPIGFAADYFRKYESGKCEQAARIVKSR